MLGEYLINLINLDSTISFRVDTKDYIGSNCFVLRKDAIEKNIAVLIERSTLSKPLSTVPNETVKNTIATHFERKFIGKLSQYKYMDDINHCVTDNNVAFNAHLYLFITEICGFDIRYQTEKRGAASKDIGEKMGLFAIVNKGEIIGSIMTLNHRAVKEWKI